MEETVKAKKTESTNGYKAKIVKQSNLDRKDAEKTSNPTPVKIQKLQRGDSAKSIKVERNEPDNKIITGTNIEQDNKVITGGKIDHRGPERVSKENQSSMKAPAKAPNAPPKLTSMVKCNDPVRDKIRELLVEALSRVYEESDDYDRERVKGSDPFHVAVSVESHMFEKGGFSLGKCHQRDSSHCLLKKWQVTRGNKRTIRSKRKPCLTVSVLLHQKQVLTSSSVGGVVSAKPRTIRCKLGVLMSQ